MKNLQIIIITGLSGSGKSTVLDAFEDAGFYCVDNMPVALLPKFLELPVESLTDIAGLAFVMDLREKGFVTRYDPIFESLKKKGYNLQILFFEADEKILLQRFSQTRRQHPLSQEKGILEGIRREAGELADLRNRANKVIDTSDFNVHKLKSVIFDIASRIKEVASMKINIVSFGYKYGIPNDADLLIDVRFLPNPYFVPELKPMTGLAEEVKAYVMSRNETQTFLQKYLNLLDYLIPMYEKEGKAYLTIATGCTGGRHRSVVVAGALYNHLKSQSKRMEITHRDMERRD